jgi:hypothetical protein
MAPQTSYAINMQPAAFPGQVADNSEIKDRLSVKAVAAALPYGLHAVIDSANTLDFANLAAKLPASAADITNKSLGVIVADQARAQNPAVGSAQYPQYSVAPAGRKGRYWVVSESAVVDGAHVYARFQTGDNGTIVGSYGGILDTSVVGNALVPNAVWRGSYSAGFAVLELDLV